MIVAVARWKSAQMDRVLALVPELRARSLEEPDCLGYEVLRSTQHDELFLIERYRDRDAVEAHRSTKHFQEIVIARILPLLTDRRVEILEPLEE